MKRAWKCLNIHQFPSAPPVPVQENQEERQVGADQYFDQDLPLQEPRSASQTESQVVGPSKYLDQSPPLQDLRSAVPQAPVPGPAQPAAPQSRSPQPAIPPAQEQAVANNAPAQLPHQPLPIENIPATWQSFNNRDQALKAVSEMRKAQQQDSMLTLPTIICWPSKVEERSPDHGKPATVIWEWQRPDQKPCKFLDEHFRAIVDYFQGETHRLYLDLYKKHDKDEAIGPAQKQSSYEDYDVPLKDLPIRGLPPDWQEYHNIEGTPASQQANATVEKYIENKEAGRALSSFPKVICWRSETRDPSQPLNRGKAAIVLWEVDLGKRMARKYLESDFYEILKYYNIHNNFNILNEIDENGQFKYKKVT